jgi:16S rRNA (adenine1518-N6/adenine1519-N6)-dimethyltransferase
MKLYSPSTITDIKARYNFQLSKSLGQNFLTDIHIIERIVEGSGAGEDDLVIEIGPGIGVLTAEAAQVAAKVIAIEIDKNLIPILQETLGEFDNVQVINQDVLKTDLNQIIADERAAGTFTGGVKIIGNLPYYITTPIIMGLLESGVEADSITVMMQKEVGDRIAAEPGTRAAGVITYPVHYYSEVTELTDVPAECFFPVPSVDSVVLRMDVRDECPVHPADEDLFFRCIKAGFSQRRKTLLNSLMSLGDYEKTQIADALDRAGIAHERRAESLTMEEFAALADSLREV